MPAIPVNGRGGRKEIFSVCCKESRGNCVARQFLFEMRLFLCQDPVQAGKHTGGGNFAEFLFQHRR